MEDSDQPEIISRAEAKARGLKFYFTGTPCNLGGFAERAVRNGGCQCSAHLEAFAELRKAYHQANREAMAESNKAYRQANKEAIAERHKSYRQANREAISRKRGEEVYLMTDGYIARVLRLPKSQITSELIALKRQQLEIYRAKKQLEQVLKEISK